MNWSMVHIFVTNFSGNASLWVQPSIFKDKVGPCHQDDGQHDDPGQALTS